MVGNHVIHHFTFSFAKYSFCAQKLLREPKVSEAKYILILNGGQQKHYQLNLGLPVADYDDYVLQLIRHVVYQKHN